LYIGTGSETSITSIEILWPSGKRQILRDVPVDRILVIEEANATRKD